MTRRNIIEAAYSATGKVGFATLFDRTFGLRRKVIAFHGVLNNSDFLDGYVNRVDLSRDLFEAQIDFLVSNYNVLPAEAINDVSAEGVILTFDDGLLNNYDTAVPILEKFGITAVFAICPGFLEREFPHLWNDHLFLILKSKEGTPVRLPMDDYSTERLVETGQAGDHYQELVRWIYSQRCSDIYGLIRELCDRNDLDYGVSSTTPARFLPIHRDRLLEMLQSGHEIVSHTWSHRPLSLLSEEEAKIELGKSREYVRGLTKRDCRTVVYPFGRPIDVNNATLQIAVRSGYSVGYLNIPSRAAFSGDLAQPRLGLTATHREGVLKCELSGLAGFVTLRKWRKRRHYNRFTGSNTQSELTWT